jgi:signal transduction histidine kinase
MRVSLRLPLIVGSAFVAFAIVTSAILIVAGRKALADAEFEHLALNAAEYGAAIKFYFESAADELEIAARLVNSKATGQEFGPDRRGKSLLTFIMSHSSVFEFLYFANIDGTIVSIEPQALEANLYRRNIEFRPWFSTTLRTGAPSVSALHIALATSRPAVLVAVPILDSAGRPVGVLAGSIKLEQLSRVGSGGLRSDSGQQFGYLTDGNGLVIAHQANPKYVLEQTDFSSEPTVQRALQGKQGTLSFFDPIERKWMLGAYLPVRVGQASKRPWAVSFAVPQDVAFAPVGSFSRTIGGTALLFALGFGLVAFLLIRRFTSPLDQLTEAVRRAAAGDFSHRLEKPLQDEFSSLTNAYNSMATELGEKNRRILEHESHLREANSRLEESNKELEAFSYSVSHDLRAPLRAIDGFSHALLEDYGEALPTEARGYLARIRHGVQMMGDLIDDMLKLSRVNRAELSRETIDLSALMQSQAQELTVRDPGRAADLVISPGMWVEADRRLVQILVSNLLENAWKFTRTKSRARIECGEIHGDGEKTFFVRDNGVGFDMKYVGKLFSAFQRLHERSEYEGTGIGLVIVQRIAAKHGGRAWADAVPGEGATFSFSLSGKEDE